VLGTSTQHYCTYKTYNTSRPEVSPLIILLSAFAGAVGAALMPPPNVVYLSNLPQEVSEHAIRQVFQEQNIEVVSENIC